MLCLKKYFLLAALAVIGSVNAAENIISLSLGDLYATGKGIGRVDTPENIEKAISSWSRMNDANAVLWRITDVHIDHFDGAKTGYIKWHYVGLVMKVVILILTYLKRFLSHISIILN